MKDAATLRKALAPRDRKPSARGSRGGENIYRIHVTWAEEDPRTALREKIPDATELAEIGRRLARLDARPTGPWTREILAWIRDNPRVVSKEPRGPARGGAAADEGRHPQAQVPRSHDQPRRRIRAVPKGSRYLDHVGG